MWALPGKNRVSYDIPAPQATILGRAGVQIRGFFRVMMRVRSMSNEQAAIHSWWTPSRMQHAEMFTTAGAGVGPMPGIPLLIFGSENSMLNS